MINVLFVDDDPMVLQGLQRTLRPMRTEWSMTFADSGAKALELMNRSPFDVVVSDMRMPHMDGADLLNEVMRRHPGTVRLVLSGHSDRSLIMKSVGAAHQYLAKPCDPETLKNVIRRTTGLNQALANQKLQRLVAKLDRLPSIPTLYTRITEALQRPEVDLREVGGLISQDLGMTAEILKVVNSAFFGLASQICSPFEAVQLLGVETVKTLVLVVHICSEYRHVRVGGVNVDALWNHSYRTASLAREIVLMEKLKSKLADEAFAAAILHDIGKLVLATNLPQPCEMVLEKRRMRRLSLCAAEQEVLGSNHAEVGGYLLGLWGLPPRLVDAVTLHHHPSTSQDKTFTPLTAVHVADWLVHQEQEEPFSSNPGELDTAYLESLDLLHHVDQWRQCLNRPEPA